MLGTTGNHWSNSAKTRRTKNKLLRALKGCLPVVKCEPLERRTLLSVSGSTLAGPILTPGTSWTYQITTAAGETGTLTRMVVGPATFNGKSVTEVDSLFGSAIGKAYIGLDAAGDIVDYGEETTTTIGLQSSLYTPFDVIFPASLTFGVPFENTYTETATDATNEDPQDSISSSSDEDNIFTIASETTESVTVPFGTFNTYRFHEVLNSSSKDGDGGIRTQTSDVDQWSAAGIGIVKIADDNGNVYALTNFTVNTEHLSFTKQPTETNKGDTLAPVVVSVLKSTGGIDADATGSITLSLVSVNGDGKLSGTVTKPIVNGVATFNDLKVDAGGTYTLKAVDDATPPVTAATSEQFQIDVEGLTWTGAGDGVNWSDPKNWDANIKPVNGDKLIFPAGSPLTSNNDLTGLSIASIDIQGSGYTLSGNSISLTSDLTSESGNNTYNIDTMLVGSPTIEDQTGDLTIKSVLSGGGLTVGGSGIVTFQQKNTYTGPTTFKAGVTIDDSVLSGAFGTAAINIGAGAKPVTIANTSSGKAQIDNDLTFANGAALAVDPEVAFEGAITVNGDNSLTAENVDDAIDLNDGEIQGSGTIFLNGLGTVYITEDVPASVKLVLQSGALDLSANLKGAADGPAQVTVTGGRLQLVAGTTGTGGIDVQDGGIMITDASNVGAGTYGGTVTLETGGTIKVSDTLDGNGLGTGTLDLKGGLLQNSSSGEIKIKNPLQFEGIPTISAGKGITFDVAIAKSTATGGISITGTAFFNVPINLSGRFDVTTSTAAIVEFNGFSGSGTVGEGGDGTTVVLGTVVPDVTLQAEAASDKNAGLLDLGAVLQGTRNQVLVMDGGAAQILGPRNGLTPLSGTGGIQVQKGGLLVTDAVATAGASGYSGSVNLLTGGTITVYDKLDEFGLGTGALLLDGGELQNDSGAAVELANDVTIGGSVTIAGQKSLLFSGDTVKFKTGGDLTVTGNVGFVNTATLNGDAFVDTSASGEQVLFSGGLDGSGSLVAGGPGSIVIEKSVAEGVKLFADGEAAGTTGRLFLAADLQGGDHQVIIASGGKVELPGVLAGSDFAAVKGTGGIDVQEGTLIAAPESGSGGMPDYSGNITLDQKGTIKLFDKIDVDGLGTGKLDIKGGVIQNGSDEAVAIDTPVTLEGKATFSADQGLQFTSDAVTFADGSSLTLFGEVVFEKAIILEGTSLIFTSLSGDQIFLTGGITGSGLLAVDGPGKTIIQGTVVDGVMLRADGAKVGTTGQLVLATELKGSGDQVTINAGGVAMIEGVNAGSELLPMTGMGGLDVKPGGTLVTDEATGAAGASGYNGDITLESDGTIKIYDAKDAFGLGTSTLTILGGTIQNSSGDKATIANEIDLEGSITLNGATGLGFTSSSVEAKASGILVTGGVGFKHAVHLSGDMSILTSDSDSLILFAGGLTGAATLSEDGPGITIVQTEIASGVKLVANGTSAVDIGGLFIAGRLDGSSDQVLIATGGRAALAGAGTEFTVTSGTGGINVQNGTLLTDGPVHGGGADYSGTITLGFNGTIKLNDTTDLVGLGTGTLILKGGLLQNTSGAQVTIANELDVKGSAQISSRGALLIVEGNVQIESAGALDLFGKIALEGGLTGSGSLTLDTAVCTIAGSNTSYSGKVFVNSGDVNLQSNDGLGTGEVLVAVSDSSTLESLDNPLDPILDNPFVIESGTLIVTGLFTFTHGVTVKPGAVLKIQGAGSEVIVSGPLAGGGTIIVDDGTFSAPGGSSAFTGSVTFQGGKAVPQITVSDAGGAFNGSSFPATALLHGIGGAPVTSLDGVSPTFTYYTGPTATGTPLAGAPSVVGQYTVVADFAGSTNYEPASNSTTFTIQTAPLNPPPGDEVQLSSLNPTFARNGWGNFERNKSNGEAGSNDGHKITLNGLQFDSGLGVHADSELRYALNGGYTRFTAWVGVDDEVGNKGSVIFQVWVDGVKKFDSGLMTGATAQKFVDIDLANKNELKLIVLSNGNKDFDHADWADAKLLKSTAAPQPPEIDITDNSGSSTDKAIVLADTPVGQSSAAWIFTLTNSGQQTLDITSFAKGGTNSGDFQITIRNDLGAVVSGSSFSIVAGKSYTITVIFKPGTTGNKSASLNFNTNDPDDNEGTITLSISGKATSKATKLSDLNPTFAKNGWGNFERNKSNGEAGSNDGHKITLNGTQFESGVGVHADSELRYALNKGYTRFTTWIGVDDEVGNKGSVIFQVWVDGVKKFDSGLMTGATAQKFVYIDLTNKNELKLIVLSDGNKDFDHADWADAKIFA